MADDGARSRPAPGPPDDDRLDAGDLRDPVQIAMDGLLSEHFDPSGDDENFIARVRARIAGPLGEREALGRADVPDKSADEPISASWRYRLGGLAGLGLAAGLLLLIAHLQTPAEADLLHDAVQQGDALFAFSGIARLPFLGNDRDALLALERDVEEWKRERDRLRDAYVASPESRTNAVFQVWQSYAVGLRELGFREESVAETLAAIEFDRRYATGHWRHIYLDCLGLTHAAFGDLAAAERAFRDSIDIRKLMPGNDGDPHRNDQGYHGHLAYDLLIPYLRMMMLNLAMGDISAARRWHDDAAAMLQQRWTTICEMAAVPLRSGATALEAYTAAPEIFRSPPPTTDAALRREVAARFKVYTPHRPEVTLLRTQLLHTAIIRRHEGDLRGAKVALQRAGKLPDFPEADEFGLPMLEAIEAARIALLEGRSEHAIAATHAAEAYNRKLGPDEPPVNLLITSPQRKAEIGMLRGLALLQQDPRSIEGRAAVEHAARLVEALSLRVRPELRKDFLARFTALRLLVKSGASANSAERMPSEPVKRPSEHGAATAE